MPYKHKRDCPICNKPNLQYISDHLRQVHKLYGNERKEYLKKAIFSRQKEDSPSSCKAIPSKRAVPKSSVISESNVTKKKASTSNKNPDTKPDFFTFLVGIYIFWFTKIY